jgi:hypothetical protein
MNGTTFHTVSEVAKTLGITRQAVQQQIWNKSIRAEWMLGRWAVSSTEIQEQKKKRKNGKRKAA